MLTKTLRYANTLILSLNNRIFFRKHASTALHSNGNPIVGSQHHHQVQVGTPIRTTMIGSNDYKTDASGMSHALEFARMKDSEGVVSVNSEHL